MSEKQTVSTKQKRIAENAQNLPEASFTALAHHIDIAWLREAQKRVRRDGAVGIDGVTAEAYEQNLEENLRDLENRMKSGSYQAPPVRRSYVAKNENEKRPIGIPTYEDKIAQKAIAMVMEPVYEQDFHDFSCGFRPGRSQHMALDRVWQEIMNMGGGYVVDLDITKFFDTMDQKLLREEVQKRVRDGVIIRMIGKWLHAGVMENEMLTRPKAGSPQGGVISPLLSNIYLHGVLDSWFEEQAKPRLRGKAAMVRFADDAVMMFEFQEDMERVMEVLPKRLEKFGLKLNEQKTQVKEFTKPQETKGRTPETFDFLGFTHYWGRSRKGNWVVKRQTQGERMNRAIKKIALWCRIHRHDPLREQQRMLNSKLRGHYSYYGITPNFSSLRLFWEQVKRIWMKWLNRRSRNPHLNWHKFNLLLKRYPLERPRIYHSFV